MMAKLSLFRQKFRHAPRYQRILSYTFVGYLVYALLLGLLTPYLIETKAPEKISTLLDRPVHLKDVSINPFTLNVKLRGFEIQTREQQKFAGIDELTVKFNLWKSIFNLSINFETVAIKHAFANIEKLDQTQFNFSDILSHLAAQASQQKPAASEPKQDAEALSTLPHIQIAAITIQDTEINYLDHPTGAKLNYPAINFELAQFNSLAQLNSLVQDNSLAQDSNAESSRPELINSPELINNPEINYNTYNLHIQGADNSSIITQGHFQVLPLKAAGNLVLKQIELTTFWPFIAQQLTAQLQTGVIDFASDYSLTTAEQDLQLVTGAGQFSLRTLKFTAAGKALINLPLLTVAGIKLNLQDQEVTLDNISTDGLQLHAQLDNEGVDLARLFTPKSAMPESTTPETTVPSTIASETTESQPATVVVATEAASVTKAQTPVAKANAADAEANSWLVTIGGFDLTNYDINLVESMVTEATPWRIYPLNLATKMITSSFNAPIEYELAVTVNNQGDFTSQGKIDVKKQSIDAQINLAKLNLVQFQPYISPYINIVLHSGIFSTKGNVYADAQDSARFQGELQLNELAISDTKLDKILVKWQAFTINQLKFDQLAHSLLIDHVALTQPYSQLIVLKDKSTNISGLFVTNKSSGDEAKTETSTPSLAPVTENAKDDMLIEINKITLTQGAVNFVDNALQPTFSATIEQLEGSVGKISSTATKNAELDIKGIANKYALMALKGEVNPLIPQPYLNVEFIFDHFELPSMTSYSGSYAGLDIDEGQLSLGLKYKLENGLLDGSNRIFIDQLDMNNSKDSSVGSLLPITLAIPLLKNSEGIIDLGVHVSGDINEPSFNVAEIVLTSLTNIVMKAVTAPFSFLASIVDSTEELDKVNFQPNSALLSADEQGQLTTLAEALTQRPEIKLNIKGSFDSKIDRQAMANQTLNMQLAQFSNSTTQASLNAANLPVSGPVTDALVKVYKQETQKDPQLLRSQLATQQPTLTSADLDQLWLSSLYQQTSAAKIITTEQLRSLARSRAKAIKTYLRDVANVGPGRIFVLSHQKDVPSESTQTVLTMAVK
jgi:hypothetical protein